jgi:hypothetical protein
LLKIWHKRTWKINLDQSENGQSAPGVVRISQTADSIVIDRIIGDKDSFAERLRPMGQHLTEQVTLSRADGSGTLVSTYVYDKQ